MFSKKNRKESRLKRHMRVRKSISGTAERPRLAVFRSERNMYAQLIDDVAQVTIASASTLDKDFDGVGSNKEAASKVGTTIAKKALDKGIDTVVFDRGGNIYHGRIQELAEAARAAGLKF